MVPSVSSRTYTILQIRELAFVSMTYDTLGRPNQQADAMGNLYDAAFRGNASGKPIDPGGTSRVSYFSPRGRTLATIDGLGSSGINTATEISRAMFYDGLDRVMSVTYPAGWMQSYTYNSNSNPLSITTSLPSGSPPCRLHDTLPT